MRQMCAVNMFVRRFGPRLHCKINYATDFYYIYKIYIININIVYVIIELCDF